MKRKIEILVLSDLHLGSKTCKAKELLNYLKSVKPQILILNGDIVNTNQLKSLPTEHLRVINRLMKMLLNGTRIYYLTGSSDASFRRFSDFSNGQLHLRDQLVLQLEGKKYWFLHGDAIETQLSWGSRLLSLFISYLPFLQKQKRAEKFEEKIIKHAHTEGYDAIVSGYTHQPKIEEKNNILYLNAGDWVENLTALEYNFGKWSLFQYDPLDFDVENPKLKVSDIEFDEDELKIILPKHESKKTILRKPKEYIVIESRYKENWAHNDKVWDGIEH